MNMTMKTALAAFAAVFVSAAADAEVVKVPAGTTTVIPLAKPAQYKVYRFVTRKIGDGTGSWLQFAELALYDAQGNRINKRLARTDKGTPYLDMPYGSCMLGGWCGEDATLEYLFYDYLPSGLSSWAKPAENDIGSWHHIYMRLEEDAPAVAAYNIAAGANGSANQRPTAWSLDGSDDGTTWVHIDEVSSAESPHYLAPDLLEGYYNDGKPIPLLVSIPWKNEYRLQAGGTLSVEKDTEIGKVVANDGTVSVAASATAAFKPAAEAETSVGGLSGAGTLEMSGAGALNVDGDNSGFTGRMDVKSGTVRFVASHKGIKAKYYRFVIHALDLDGTHKYCQIGELALYDALGNRINLGLTASSATAVADMDHGTCASSAIGGRFYPGATVPKAFDGDKNTSAEGWAECKPEQNNSWTWGHVYMRLAEDAPAVWAYDFTTGPDPVNNWYFNVISWSFESSDDGVNWTVHHFVDEETGRTYVPTAAGVGYSGGDTFGISTAAATVPPSAAALSVASGAKLVLPADSSVAQTRLVLDLTKGEAGEIVNFRFADSGVLELTCSEAKPKFQQQVLSVTLTDAADAANFANWSVTVNGKEQTCYKLSVSEDGKLVIDKTVLGLTVIIK